MASVAATRGEPARRDGQETWPLGALFAFALVVGAYFTFRFGGRWSEWDTATQADSIRTMVRDATLLSPSGSYYGNGYTFSAVSTFLIAFTGVDAATLLQALFPLISASLVLIAWPLYRELTGSGQAATLGTLFLFIQPDFLFVILRGSHERILRALLLISLWLLVRSFTYADRTREYSAYVALFYLVVYAMLATNSFFGSSFVWALTVALIGSWFGALMGPRIGHVSLATRRRLIYVPLLCTVLVFVFNGYIYPPAGAVLTQLPDTLQRLSRLLLTTSPEQAQPAFNPYQVVFDSWIDVRIYFLVSLGTYLLILTSAFVWVRTGLRWLSGSGEPPTLGQWMLFLFYAAFALQGAMSVVADRAGTLGGNLQYRSFPSFVMVAAPLVAGSLARWRPNRRKGALAAAFVGLLALLAIVKATNEPTLSNVWTFYLPAEVQAVKFADQHLKDDGYWSDFDERLRSVQILLAVSNLPTFLGNVTPNIRAFVVSDVTRLRAARLGRPLPRVGGELRVYDNGSAQIFRTRSLTPYQD